MKKSIFTALLIASTCASLAVVDASPSFAQSKSERGTNAPGQDGKDGPHGESDPKGADKVGNERSEERARPNREPVGGSQAWNAG